MSTITPTSTIELTKEVREYVRFQFYRFIEKAVASENNETKLGYFHLAKILWDKNPSCFSFEDADEDSFESVMKKSSNDAARTDKDQPRPSNGYIVPGSVCGGIKREYPNAVIKEDSNYSPSTIFM
jgi:hypothetical protein